MSPQNTNLPDALDGCSHIFTDSSFGQPVLFVTRPTTPTQDPSTPSPRSIRIQSRTNTRVLSKALSAMAATSIEKHSKTAICSTSSQKSSVLPTPSTKYASPHLRGRSLNSLYHMTFCIENSNSGASVTKSKTGDAEKKKDPTHHAVSASGEHANKAPSTKSAKDRLTDVKSGTQKVISKEAMKPADGKVTVSYTHLTLPTKA